MSVPDPALLMVCVAGVAGGLVALWRGLVRYRSATLVAGLSTSRIATLAAGEVRVTGTVEVAEVLLRSPLQDRECVWYRSKVEVSGRNGGTTFHEERGIGFRLRDATGTIRVFPRGARLDVPDRFDERTGLLGDLPVGLAPRQVASVANEPPLDHDAAVAALLTVHPPLPAEDLPGLGDSFGERGSRRFIEARLEPGDVVTIVGAARPFGQLEDPAAADALDGSLDPLGALEDPAIAADIEAARAAGTLTTPEEAWGNAAIPGFGIGRPVREPELDPAAQRPVLASAAEAAAIETTFDLEPDLLVLASAPDAPLLVAWGAPAEVTARDRGAFLVGLLGAALAIVSALAGAALLSGG
ncbi:MAG: hypothetical protein WCK58_07725 [Chloroflexota bacterium]